MDKHAGLPIQAVPIPEESQAETTILSATLPQEFYYVCHPFLTLLNTLYFIHVPQF